MNRAIAWFAENHVAANLVMLVIIGAGIFTIPSITQELIPSIELDMISISVPYPGASPEEVEQSITNRLEEELEGLQGISHLRSISAEGLSSVTIELLAGEDVRKRLDEIRAQVDTIDNFPEDAEEPLVRQADVQRQVLSIAITGNTDEYTLKRLAQQVRDDLTNFPGITEVKLNAVRPYEVSIELSENALRRFGLHFDDISAAVRSSSLDLPGGSIKSESGEILLRALGQAYSKEEFERIALVSRADGTRLQLGDVAIVKDGFAETDLRTRFDGKPAALVQVFRVGKQKSLEISRIVNQYVETAGTRFPAGISLTVWQNDSEVLRDRLETLLNNAGLGFIFVLIVLALFLRLRLALWVSLGIPISFLGAVALMPSLDMSVNFISLLGFIVVLGIVVDDAIVVGENAHTEPTLTIDRLNRRRQLMEQLDAEQRRLENTKHQEFERVYGQAFDLLSSDKLHRALDIRREADRVRDRYGRHLFGQSALMGRRMLEAGARFVTVLWDAPDGYSWDSHQHSKDLKNHLLPGLDQTFSALLEDLQQRGLLDETLVVCVGEMGRTPKGNAQWGRGHWSHCFPAVLAGAGVRGGSLYGRSDSQAGYPVADPVSPEDLSATIFQALGISPETRIEDAQGRPVSLVEGGSPLTHLFS